MNTKVEMLLDVFHLAEIPYDNSVWVEFRSKGQYLRIDDRSCPKYLPDGETALDYPCLVRKFVKENNITLGDKIKITLEKVEF